MVLPSVTDVNNQRIARFKQRIAGALRSAEAKAFLPLLEQFEAESDVPALEIAAALASLVQGTTPFLLEQRPEAPAGAAPAGRTHRDGASRAPRPRAERPGRGARPDREPQAPGRGRREATPPLETFRIEVGSAHGAQPANIVGAIANEAGVDGRHIGHIDIHEDHSFVDLPVGMPDDIFKDLQSVQIRGTPLRISRAAKPARPARPAGRPHKPQRKGRRF